MQTLLSAVTCIPRQTLFGKDTRKNAFGLSMSHSHERFTFESWYGYVARIQTSMLKPSLAHLIRILLQAAYNTGEIDGIPKISIEFRPLWSMSELEQAEAERQKAIADLKCAEAAKIYYQAGAITPKEIRADFLGKYKK